MACEIITFEQPLNEHIRICLRLEFLFQQTKYFIRNNSDWDSRIALASILEMLNLVDRPDLKNKLGQALNQFAASLIQLEKKPNVDKEKLDRTIAQIDAMIDLFHQTQGKIGLALRENDFLFAFQQRLHVPAGGCNFNLPALHLWLSQDIGVRQNDLQRWLNEFTQIRNIVDLLLKLTRECTLLNPQTAQSGFFQTSLDPTVPYQMIRIAYPQTLNLYPEVSVGRHRLTLHFFEFNSNTRAIQTQQDVIFELACCKI